MIIEAENLKDAYNKAASELGCSVTQLNVRVLQHPSGGFLGFFKKNAVIEAVLEGEKFSENPEFNAPQNKVGKAEKKQGDKSESQSPRTTHSKHRKEKQKGVVTDEILSDIKEKLSALFRSSEFNIEVSDVSKIDENTVYIKLQGEDSALLIGKEGHRYKALSYMIYNWISIRYDLAVVFEIAEFLQNQERFIESYVNALVERSGNERIVTKAFDGAFIKIVADKLKQAYPDRFVGIKSTRSGKIVIVDEKS
ncbi:Jag N-terminal domain-containing protein [uncultured Campylobacter sp.]|uniref:Jag N-terminal domain-containing protein n=1 Tax=uncultured Campylobacter sp. TaxID=218934 RepID=UPI00261EA8E9|nr:Jag N-terminal domain-containing protein [uncultured Campylobacter sp.]